MKTNKLKKKYTNEELAESFVFRNKLTEKQNAEARNQLAVARQKVKKERTAGEEYEARLLQLRYQMEDYLKSSQYDERLSFSHFLRTYIRLSYKIYKDFAKDINIDATELSQILNSHRNPNERTFIKLEIHSNNIISAVTWYKLIGKEKTRELETNKALREEERKLVKVSRR